MKLSRFFRIQGFAKKNAAQFKFLLSHIQGESMYFAAFACPVTSVTYNWRGHAPAPG